MLKKVKQMEEQQNHAPVCGGVAFNKFAKFWVLKYVI